MHQPDMTTHMPKGLNQNLLQEIIELLDERMNLFKYKSIILLEVFLLKLYQKHIL
jgi:hypothetical protein